MRTIPDFENELKAINPNLRIVPNPNRPMLANIKLDGVDICPVPAYEIRDIFDPTYTIELPNGRLAPHKSRAEALEMVKHILGVVESKDGADAFFGRNGY